jgi:hypothetical protein
MKLIRSWPGVTVDVLSACNIATSGDTDAE